MRGSSFAAVLLVASLAGSAHGRLLLQDSSSTSVSFSGGQGPYGNCGITQTTGNAAAYASGPPCGSTVTPAPPPILSCPATTVTVDWQTPGAGSGYKNLTLCPGSTVVFKWNTGKPDLKYGLSQIPGPSCPSSPTAPDIKLIITPASSPNDKGQVSATLNAPGSYFFADIANCPRGQLQGVIVTSTAAAGFAEGQPQPPPYSNIGQPVSPPAPQPSYAAAGQPGASVGPVVSNTGKK